jgi:hypothetical protein
MSTSNATASVSAGSGSLRARLEAAIKQLTARNSGAANALALAEAHFRLAVLPDTDSTEALAHLRDAVALDSIHPKFHFHLGRVLHKCGDSRAAVCAYRQALRLAPSSHRTWTHLAIALADLGEPHKKLGQDLLDSLFRNVSVREMLPAVDDVIRSWTDDSGKAPASRKAPDSKAAIEECRYRAIARISLVEHVSRAKLQRRALDKCLDSVKADGPAEYALACLQLMVAGDPPADVAAMLEDAGHAHPGDTSIRLASAAARLARIVDAAEFANCAVTALRNGELPVELIVWLHYAAFGPDGKLPAPEALRALDRYPAEPLRQPAFVELRIAVLDGFARRAWSDSEFARARLLWREAAALDPYRIETAHNLALLAARTKSHEDYSAAWLRAAEVRYLNAAASGEVLAGLEDRRLLHLAVLQQAEAFCWPSPKLKDEEYAASVAGLIRNYEAMETVLREWDLYYLNSRLRFRSPVHVLGIARDASPEDTVAARDGLKTYFDNAMNAAHLAGGQAFAALARAAIDEAYAHASVNAERARDPYWEPEKAEADQFAAEAVAKGVDFIQIVRCIEPGDGAWQPAARILRSLCGLPWMTLQNVALKMGAINAETDLRKVLAIAYLSVLQMDPAWHPARQEDFDAKLAEVQRDLRTVYTSALPDDIVEAYHSTAGIAAMDALKSRLDNLRSIEDVEKIEASLRGILDFAPRAHVVRLQLSSLLLSVKTAKFVERSISLLEAGLALKPAGEIAEKMREMLAEAQSVLPGARKSAEAHDIIDTASKDLDSALEELNKHPNAEAIRNTADAARRAVAAGERAYQVAQCSGNPDLLKQVEDVLAQFKSVEQQLKGA